MNRTLLTLLLFLAVPLLVRAQTTEAKAQPQSAADELRFVTPIKGWAVAEEALQNYDIGIDTQTSRGGKASAFAKAKPVAGATNVVVLRQSIVADRLRGHRVRLTGWLKTEEVTGWAGLWLRINDQQGFRLSLDNMQNRPVRNTSDWQRCDLVLNVPDQALAISFGLVLVGKGQVWMDDLRLEPAPPEATTTERYGKAETRPDDEEYTRRRVALARRLFEELKSKPVQPVNLDFESPRL